MVRRIAAVHRCPRSGLRERGGGCDQSEQAGQYRVLCRCRHSRTCMLSVLAALCALRDHSGMSWAMAVDCEIAHTFAGLLVEDAAQDRVERHQRVAGKYICVTSRDRKLAPKSEKWMCAGRHAFSWLRHGYAPGLIVVKAYSPRRSSGSGRRRGSSGRAGQGAGRWPGRTGPPRWPATPRQARGARAGRSRPAPGPPR